MKARQFRQWLGALALLVLPQTAAAELVVLPQNIVAKEYTLEGVLYTPIPDVGVFNPEEKEMNIRVGVSGNDIYVQGLAHYFPEGWIKGSIDGGHAIFASGQLIGTDSQGNQYVVGSDDGTTITDAIVFDYDAEAGTLLQQTRYLVLNDLTTEKLNVSSYWYHTYLYPGAAEPLQAVELPEGFVADTYLLKAQRGTLNFETQTVNFGKQEAQVMAGIAGNDLYLQCFSDEATELWAKATKNADGNYVVPANQFMGLHDIGGWGVYFDKYFFTAIDDEGRFTDAVFTYDALTGTITNSQTLALNRSRRYLDPYFEYKDVEMTRLTDLALMPVQPKVVSVEEVDTEYPLIHLDVPAKSTTGDELLLNKLFYTIYIEKDGEVKPLVFPADLYAPEFTADVTEIPYTHSSWNFTQGGEYVYLNHGSEEVLSWTRLGVQSIYYGGGEVTKTDIYWVGLDKGNIVAGISASSADSGTAEYYDLNGCRVDGSQQGVLIMKQKDANGRTMTKKFVRK